MNFFPSRWPIMCAVMNSVSDMTLACAVHEAGAMPSLLVNWKKIDRDYDLLNSSLNEFVKSTGSNHVVIQLDYTDLKDDIVLNMIEHYKISHIELFGLMGLPRHREQQEFDLVMRAHRPQFQRLRKTARIITRIFTPSSGQGIDAYALKGSDSAGLSGMMSVKELFIQQQQSTPSMPLVPYGGVGTPEQVAWYINNGAAGVAVGTLFAATKESCINDLTKQAMIASTDQDLAKLSSHQQALVLGTVSNDPNHQQSLNDGIAGTGGLIYAGKSINHVKEIKTVKQVVDYLTQDLVRQII